MQVSKQLLTSRDATGIKGIIRKFRDIYISVFKIEKKYTKEEIIEFYVNTPGLGYNTFGVEQASQTYFGKSVRDLTLAEASLLAGIFNAPTSYNPFNSIELATQRRSIVLNLMVHHGYITEEQKEDAESIPVESLLNQNLEFGSNKYQAFVDTVIAEVTEKTGSNPTLVSMQIYTTLDPEAQDVINGLNDGTLGYTFKNDVVQTAVALTSVKDGSLVAIYGGRNYAALGFNRATDKKKHLGSTAKPIFDYGPFIEYNNGSPYTPFFDDKMTYSDGTSLKNSDGGYLGMIPMRTALYRSRNIPAVQAFQQVDKNNIAEFVHNLGIDYGDDLFESMAIGGFDGVSAVELSAAYAAFGRNGYYIEPYSVTKVIFNDTGEEKEFKYEPVKAMSEETAYMITNILITATKNGVGGNFNVSGTEIGSKTGTSTYDASALKNLGVSISASRDNWTSVYSPDYSLSVWYGYDKLMKDYYTMPIDGANQKKKITSLIVNKIFKKNSKFTKPSGIVSAKVELETFPPQSPSEYTPADMITTELFKKGTEPSSVSKRYSQLENPTNGKSTNTGSTVVLSWDPISTPEAIDSEYLQKHFKEYYTKWADKYYNQRINYNNSKIGVLGYHVYQNINGNLVSLGFTSTPSFSTTCTGDCSFVIKSSYSIFTSNMSSGLTINTTNNSGSSEPEDPPITNPTSKLVVDIHDVCIPVSDTYEYNDEEESKTNNPIKVTYEGKDISNEVKITRDTNKINLKTPSNNTITYTITYKSLTTKATRKVKVANTCN